MIEIESVKIKIGKKVVEVTKDEADLAKLLEAVGEKPPAYIPVPYYPPAVPWYPINPYGLYTGDYLYYYEDGGTTDAVISDCNSNFTAYDSDNITLTGGITANA